jgi:hypothetical protein
VHGRRVPYATNFPIYIVRLAKIVIFLLALQKRMMKSTFVLWTSLLVLLDVSESFTSRSLPLLSNKGAVLVKRRELETSSLQSFTKRESLTSLQSTILGDDDHEDENAKEPIDGITSSYQEQEQEQESRKETEEKPTAVKSLIDGLPFVELFRAPKKLPPIQVDDANLLLYDVFLIINLTLSISFWVTHRMEFDFLPFAFSEGCLLSIFWIASGLYHGMFLYSAVDGHYGSSDERGGPKAAATLALNTFVSAVNLRLVFAFLVAVAEHRPVGLAPSEELLPLEIGFGLLLMSSWRALHSFSTPRL